MQQRAGYQDVPPESAGPAGRSWWDENAAEYLDEHGGFLGDDDFCWCPEGLREADAHLLGDVTGADILEIGAGAAQCSRWLRGRGAQAVATDLSGGMLGARRTLPETPPLVQADARALPFADASFDAVFTAYGAIPFVPDARTVHAEAARVLRPGGRWVFSVTHPVRWAFPDDPTERGLTATSSYFDRTPYAERDDAGRVTYVEYHRTVGDHVRDVVAAGLEILDIVEPEWPAGHDRAWGGWSPVRGRVLPGTAIFVTRWR
ncbi:class I SAM-dependent methyltransferase [Sanguibacter massiliensis]|uniref:class I SAM-dependent methyltransferase n=1 Tax=Sanguibacter massiliensis TaxID=1973217 RepID=UPI000C849733|nr:class I SAM-dependent methyltransferase [Sanguibacter massiliensis]